MNLQKQQSSSFFKIGITTHVNAAIVHTIGIEVIHQTVWFFPSYCEIRVRISDRIILVRIWAIQQNKVTYLFQLSVAITVPTLKSSLFGLHYSHFLPIYFSSAQSFS